MTDALLLDLAYLAAAYTLGRRLATISSVPA